MIDTQTKVGDCTTPAGLCRREELPLYFHIKNREREHACKTYVFCSFLHLGTTKPDKTQVFSVFFGLGTTKPDKTQVFSGFQVLND